MSEPAPSIAYAVAETDSDPFIVALGVIGLKLLGLQQLIESLIYLPSLVLLFTSGNLLGSGSEIPLAVMYGATMSFKIAVGLIALSKAAPISRRLFSGVRSGEREPIDAVGWLTLILVGIAVLTMLNAIPSLIAAGTNWLSTQFGTNMSFRTASSVLFSQTGLVGSTVQLGLGIVLLLFARPIARWGLQTAMRKS